MRFKKITTLAIGVLASVSLLAACSNSSSSNLTVSTFGLSTKQMRRDVLNPFAKKNDVKVKTQFGDSSTRLTQIEHNSNSGVDVVELAQNNAVTGQKKGLFKKLDFSKLKNYKYLSASEKKLAKETNSIPYTVNSLGIIYNPKKVKINDWKDLWSSKLKGKIAIPDITTTFGPAMLYIAGDYAGTAVTKDGGTVAFKALKQLKPNVVKTYTQSSDLSNMFKTGEISVAVVGDYAVGMLQSTNKGLKYFVPNSGTYANYDNVSILKNSKNTEAAYKYIDYRLSKSVQKKVAGANSLNNAPVNSQVKLSSEEAANKTYGSVAKRAKTINFFYVNNHISKWITKWNKIMNQ
ncbi:ABC transporter substrate-binding protein [Lactobacillus corticis]|uniref:Spermidine/putrescine ABC transporter substrate-binding protein n=1 Tax=Lactobacillus corticis TaxID=2201249 RepID=A0A916QF61_9LACO|nr:ABC transporter substrate-binding protein [Lactobacillus corticis]GFZ26156.1 spermidine/putrescine ABC transporter substrate-binding protein [Lactobacillus corticis]